MTDNRGSGINFAFKDIPLSKKVGKGVLWVTAATTFARALNVVSSIILARLLGPEDYGLMAIALAIIAFSQGLTITGFDSALIQKQENIEEYLNTSWTFELIRNLVLALIIFLTAPLLSFYFNEPRAKLILEVMSITYVLQGLRNIGVVYFRKNLEFHKQFVLEMIPMIISISAVIPLAYVLKNVWALVFSTLISQAIALLLSYILHPFRPRFEWDLKKVCTLFDFGKWILGASIIVMIREQGITMFIGKLLGAVALGFYNRSTAFSLIIFQQINEIVWKVGYPLYSQLQNEPSRLKGVFLKTTNLLSFIVFPMAGGLFVLSEDFTRLLLTEKWMPIVPMMKIFCIMALFSALATPANVMFQALGKPGLVTKISCLNLIILLIAIYPFLILFNETGVALSLLLSVIITSPISWVLSLRTSHCSLTEYINSFIHTTLCTSIMIICCILIKMFFVEIKYLEFFTIIFISAFIFLVSSFAFEKLSANGPFITIRKLLLFSSK